MTTPATQLMSAIAMPNPHWTQYASVFLTAVIACFAVWIAWQQAKTARAKLKLDLFEKRLAQYNEIDQCLNQIFATGSTTPDNDQRFLKAKHQAKWLFGEDVRRYLEHELWKRIGQLHYLHASLNGLEASEERKKKLQEMAELKLWFASQCIKDLESIFRPYLGFDKWK